MGLSRMKKICRLFDVLKLTSHIIFHIPITNLLISIFSKYKLVGKGVPRAKKGEDCSLIVAQCARKVTSGEVIFGPGDIMGNATRLEGCKAKNPPITVR